MPKKTNAVWRFFASVKLALFTLFILAGASVIGTLIKQDQAPAYYAREYGPKLAQLFAKLGLTDMYSSWWFITILSLFAVNLLVCSLQRLPGVWRVMTMDNLSVDLGQLELMSFSEQAVTALGPEAVTERVRRLMAGAGWKKPARSEREGAILLFSHKGRWSRLGVYMVHLSILVILAGVLIGSFFGFQAYVYLPEGRTTSEVFLRRSEKPFPLGFQLRNDRFEKTFYPNGLVREYRSDLTVIDPQRKTPYRKSIIVNDPLSYRGLTFYLGDGLPREDFFVVIHDQQSGREQAFRIPSERDVAWPGTKISFRIEALKLDQQDAVSQAQIRLTSGTAGASSLFRVKDKGIATVHLGGEDYTVSFRQLYSTLLLVKKDPGIPIVYAGCLFMMGGLIICFFLSHRRLWVRITTAPRQGSQVLFSATTNKNPAALEQKFQKLIDRWTQDSARTARK
jgi:cytochrome c biogenesis protein